MILVLLETRGPTVTLRGLPETPVIQVIPGTPDQPVILVRHLPSLGLRVRREIPDLPEIRGPQAR